VLSSVTVVANHGGRIAVLALPEAAVQRPDLAFLGVGIIGALAVLVGVLVFRFIYFGRSR
jgi:hypothetical protein